MAEMIWATARFSAGIVIRTREVLEDKLDRLILQIIKNTVTLIDTNHNNVEHRRYTNFGLYEDRITNEIVLILPEMPKIDWQDLTSDCYRYRIRIEE